MLLLTKVPRISGREGEGGEGGGEGNGGNEGKGCLRIKIK